MVRNTGHTSKYYLISRLILSFLFTIPLFGQDSTKAALEKDSTFYPGKPLIMSLIVPGLGQLYNKEPLWKPGIFIATEIVSITSIIYSNKKADEIRMNYQEFADENWNIKNWWDFTQSGPEVIENNGLFFTDNKLILSSLLLIASQSNQAIWIVKILVWLKIDITMRTLVSMINLLGDGQMFQQIGIGKKKM